jgi:hypothetical protein
MRACTSARRRGQLSAGTPPLHASFHAFFTLPFTLLFPPGRTPRPAGLVHSALIAVAGSTAVDRRAGTTLATTAAIVSTAAAHA